MSLSCNACRSKCCNNNTKRAPQSSKVSDNNSNNLTASKLDEKTEEYHSIKCSPVPFILPLLDILSTSPRTNTVSPLSATEVESDDSIKLPENHGEEDSETTNDLKKNDEISPIFLGIQQKETCVVIKPLK